MQMVDELAEQQKAYLKAMDIDIWVRRNDTQNGDVASSSQEVVSAQFPPSAVIPERPAGIEPSLTPDNQLVPLAELDWTGLEQRVMSCRLCDLYMTRTQAVFGVGNQQADWLIIGEAPGADEDRQGEPFVGRAGQLLNAMLNAIDLSREQVYIANILKCRPPNNRDPKPEEEACCTPYLERQIELIQPSLILALGRIAAQRLLQTSTSLGRLRGKVHEFAATGTPVIVTYHPAYLLRSPGEKRKAWQDLLFAREFVTSASSKETVQ